MSPDDSIAVEVGVSVDEPGVQYAERINEVSIVEYFGLFNRHTERLFQCTGNGLSERGGFGGGYTNSHYQLAGGDVIVIVHRCVIGERTALIRRDGTVEFNEILGIGAEP